MQRMFSAESFASRGFTSQELAIIAPAKVTSEHVMTAIGIAGDVIQEQEKWRNQLLNMGKEIEVVDVETPSGVKKFNAEAYYQVMNLSKHWARLTRLFLRYPEWTIATSEVTPGQTCVSIADMHGVTLLGTIFEDSQRSWLRKFISKEDKRTIQFQKIDGMTLMGVVNDLMERGEKDICIAIHPYCELAEDGILQEPGDSPPFQIHGQLLQSLLAAGAVVHLEHVLWSMKHQPESIPDEYMQNRMPFEHPCYWRNTLPAEAGGEPGFECSVSVDIGPDNEFPQPTLIGNMVLDCIENNVDVSWPWIPANTETVSENLVWTIADMEKIRDRWNIQKKSL